jgi:hypothetical protein
MRAHDGEELKVITDGGRQAVRVPSGRGEELRHHLASHGINARVSPAAGAAFERLEVEGDVHADVLQAIVDQWER